MHADNWANKAKQEGYRTRAVYKLDEIIQKTRALKKKQNVLDLGSAPGGWSQYIKKKSPLSDVYAIDILEMDRLDGVHFFLNSIEEINEIETALANAQVIDVKDIPETGRVVFGSTIKLYDVGAEKELSYKLVGNLESNPEKGHISIDTPIAKGLVGKFVDDEVSIETPSGKLTYEIIEVKHI